MTFHKRLHTDHTFDTEQVVLNEKAPLCGALQSPLPDSNRGPPPYHGFGAHTRTHAITRDTVSPANRAAAGGRDASRGVAPCCFDVSVLCPRTVDGADNSACCDVVG
jgi:hypothetical protein